MKECTYLTCNRRSDSWENGKKSELEKITKGRRGERTSFPPPTLSLLLSSTSVFFRPPFRATVHYPLSTTPETGQFIVYQRGFSNADARDLQMSKQEHLTSKSSHSRYNYSCCSCSISKTPLFFLFSVVLYRKVFGYLFLMMVFHRRSKRIKIFSKTFVTKYLYSVIVIHRNVHVY